jgi:hypothetical protein
VVCDKTKKMMTQQNSCTTQPKQIFMVLLITKTFTLFLEICAQLYLYLSKYGIQSPDKWQVRDVVELKTRIAICWVIMPGAYLSTGF